MEHYWEVGIADSVAAFSSSPDDLNAAISWEIFWFQIKEYVQILIRPSVRLGIKPQLL